MEPVLKRVIIQMMRHDQPADDIVGTTLLDEYVTLTLNDQGMWRATDRTGTVRAWGSTVDKAVRLWISERMRAVL